MKNLLFFLCLFVVGFAHGQGSVQYGGIINAKDNSGAIGPIRRTINGLEVSDSITQRLLSNPLSITGSVSITGTVAIDSSKTRLQQQVNVLNFPATQQISGTVLVDSTKSRIQGQVNVLNFPVTQPVSIATAIPIDSTKTRIQNQTTVLNFPASQPVTISSLPLPTNAATSTKQSDGSQKTQIVDGSGNAVGTTGNAIDVNIKSGGAPGTQPISAASLPLPTGAAEESGGNLDAIKTAVNNLDAGTPAALGQTTKSASMPVVLPSDEIVTLVTGQATQTATVNNILTTSSGTAATDVSQFKSFAVQIISTGTAGTYIFEGSSDNSHFVVIPVYNYSLAQPPPIIAAVTASSSNIMYVGSCNFQYLRVRIATTITGGSIQAFSALSKESFTPASVAVFQAGAGNLNVNVSTLSQFASANSAADAFANPSTTDIKAYGMNYNGSTWDRNRGNFNTTTGDAGTKTATFNGATQTNYNARGATITVLCGTVSGSTPTLNAQLQYSYDGTNFLNIGAASSNVTATGNTIIFQIYPTNFSVAGATPAALTTGATQTVQLNMILPRTWRLVYTIGGSTPSFAITAVYVNYQL